MKEIIKPGTNFDFIGKRTYAYILSGGLLLLTILLLLYRGGPNFGVDFTGGVLVQVRLPERHTPQEIKKALEPLDLQDSVVQEFESRAETEYLIRANKMDVALAGLGQKVGEAMSTAFGQGVEIRRVEMVGAAVGKDLRQKALLAILYSLLFMAIYISGRFEHKWLISALMAGALALATSVAAGFGVGVTWLILIALIVTLGLCWVLNLKYALGAIVALIHDVVVTVGAFALTDREISLPVVAAILTIIGFSINDTIVIFDRIRENLHKTRKTTFGALINIAVNETLSRTILTSGTVLITVLAIFLFGGGVINDFAFAMLVGVVSGTYSTVYIASPILLLWEKPGQD